MMDLAMGKLAVVVEDLIAEYELDRSFISLVGGGGTRCGHRQRPLRKR